MTACLIYFHLFINNLFLLSITVLIIIIPDLQAELFLTEWNWILSNYKRGNYKDVHQEFPAVKPVGLRFISPRTPTIPF